MADRNDTPDRKPDRTPDLEQGTWTDPDTLPAEDEQRAGKSGTHTGNNRSAGDTPPTSTAGSASNART